MLLPSALTCDSSQPQAATASSAPKARTRYQSALFASPPLSPTPDAHSTITNIYSTCRALQSMLTTATRANNSSSNAIMQQLPSPPTVHAQVPASPFKLRLRARKPVNPTSTTHPEAAIAAASSSASAAPRARRRIAKRVQPAPRGLNKRRRALDDDLGRGDDDDSEMDEEEHDDHSETEPSAFQPPSRAPATPKRMRLAPEILPLGLERADFHALELSRRVDAEGDVSTGTDTETEEGVRLRARGPTRRRRQSQPNQDHPASSSSSSSSHHPTNNDEQTPTPPTTTDFSWSSDEDRMLVELVLEKLKLTRSEWQDCARTLGKDRGSVGRRWKSLMGRGEVGLLKPSSSRTGGGGGRKLRREGIHATWR